MLRRFASSPDFSLILNHSHFARGILGAASDFMMRALAPSPKKVINASLSMCWRLSRRRRSRRRKRERFFGLIASASERNSEARASGRHINSEAVEPPRFSGASVTPRKRENKEWEPVERVTACHGVGREPGDGRGLLHMRLNFNVKPL